MYPDIANAAHFFAHNTFNYFDEFHNRNSINNAGMPLISNVKYREPPFDDPYANAFWDGQQMVYGDGGFFAADDVVAHELSHGVTEFSSGLFYFYESGAINESMSDIFGEFADQWNGIDSFGVGEGNLQKWALGEDVMPFGAVRNMQNPPLFDQPDRTQSSIYWKFVGDNGGVHINSGVSNKAAYLMAQGGTFNGYTITALGNEKTGAIFYEVNTNLLTSGADFSILGAAIVQACNNILAGPNPLSMTAANCNEAREATLATQMHLDPVAGVVFRPKADICPANFFVDAVFYDDLESGFSSFTSDILVGGTTITEADAWMDTIPAVGGPYAVSGTGSVFGVNHPAAFGLLDFDPYLSAFQMTNPVVLPLGSSYYLHFNHSFALEYSTVANYDGAVLEYQVDGGAWLDASALYDSGQGYNGTIYVGFGNPLAGRNAFVQQSHGYVSTRYNLKSLAGHSIRFRWLIGADNIESYYGWFLDDIQIYNCISNTAAPLPQFTEDTTPTLTWNRVTYATTYEVQIATNSNFTENVVSYPGLPASGLSFNIPAPLTPGTWYWRVRAYSGATPKSWSPTQTITISP